MGRRTRNRRGSGWQDWSSCTTTSMNTSSGNRSNSISLGTRSGRQLLQRYKVRASCIPSHQRRGSFRPCCQARGVTLTCTSSCSSRRGHCIRAGGSSERMEWRARGTGIVWGQGQGQGGQGRRQGVLGEGWAAGVLMRGWEEGEGVTGKLRRTRAQEGCPWGWGRVTAMEAAREVAMGVGREVGRKVWAGGGTGGVTGVAAAAMLASRLLLGVEAVPPRAQAVQLRVLAVLLWPPAVLPGSGTGQRGWGRAAAWFCMQGQARQEGLMRGQAGRAQGLAG